GTQRSDSTTISESGEGANDAGRLVRSVGSCRTASAIFSMTLRLAVGRMSPGMPTRSPPCTRTSAKANAIIMARSSLLLDDKADRKVIDGERSDQIQTVGEATHSRSRT